MLKVAESKTKIKDSPLFSVSPTVRVKEGRQRLYGLMSGKSTQQAVLITPEMAEIMLEFNTGNRLVSKPRVAAFSDEMKNGNWHITGQPIIFSEEPRLNDGQHRLHACVASGVAFRSDVRFGVERDAFYFTDIGAKRTAGDALTIHGEKNANVLAAALRLVSAFYSDDRSFGNTRLTPHATVLMLEKHLAIRRSAEIGSRTYVQFKLIEPSTLAFVHYICAHIDQVAADPMLEDIATGFVPKNDPVFVLRRLFINEGTKRKIRLPESAAFLIKTWNSRRLRKTPKTLVWRSSGDAAEAFPQPV